MFVHTVVRLVFFTSLQPNCNTALKVNIFTEIDIEEFAEFVDLKTMIDEFEFDNFDDFDSFNDFDDFGSFNDFDDFHSFNDFDNLDNSLL